MKKNFLLSLLILLSINVMSQEKGAYLTLSGGVGPTGYKYVVHNVNFALPKCNILVGGNVGVGFSYYFTKNIGVSLGLDIAHYRTNGRLVGEFGGEYSDKFVNLGNYTDNDFGNHITNYELRVRTQNWLEYQSGKLLEIPLTVNFQKKFGDSEFFGLYLAAGVKFQFPVGTKYTIKDGEEDEYKLNITGYYEDHNVEFGRWDDPDMSHHSFGLIHNPSEKLMLANSGKLNHKFNLSATIEGGILLSLSRRVDLSLGAFVDIGLLNIKKSNLTDDIFIGPTGDYVAGAEDNIGNGITYNSITTSKYVDHVSTLSYGGKIGVRIKLGKLSEKQQPEPLPQQRPLESEKDTVYVYVYEKAQVDSLLNELKNSYNEMPKNINQNNVPNNIESQPIADSDILLEPVYFDLNKAILKPDGMRTLNKKVQLMNKYPELRLLIIGNTCDLGEDKYNYKLGSKRADAAKNYMVKKGIDPQRLVTSTMSKYEPEKPNTNEANRTHNRRDDFRPIHNKNNEQY